MVHQFFSESRINGGVRKWRKRSYCQRQDLEVLRSNEQFLISLKYYGYREREFTSANKLGIQNGIHLKGLVFSEELRNR